ncbi:MAG: CBS domain-containing protein [Vicinamibacteria bacterium]
MKVEDLMTTGVGTCRPYDGADQAARVMWEQDCGSVPVVDQDGRVVAMITDRDICIAALTQGRPIGEIRVSSAMSRKLWNCRPDDDVKDAEKVMRAHQVRRLPVVQVDGKLAGILSISDLARAAVSPKKETTRTRKKAVEPADVGETLGAISVPAAPR